MRGRLELAFMIILALALGLSACSGGGDSDDGTMPTNSVTLTGTAATGMPIRGTVTIRGTQGGTVTVQSDDKGRYSAKVTNLKAPLVIHASGRSGDQDVSLYSYLDNLPAPTSSGSIARANITPLTNVALADALGEDPEVALAGNAEVPQNIGPQMRQTLTRMETLLKSIFTSVGLDPDEVDLLSVDFSADGGGLDAVFDAIAFKVRNQKLVLENKNADPSAPSAPLYEQSLGQEPDQDAVDQATAEIENKVKVVEFSSFATALKSTFDYWRTLPANTRPSEATVQAKLAPILAQDFLNSSLSKDKYLQAWSHEGVDEKHMGFAGGTWVSDVVRIAEYPTFTSPDFSLSQWNNRFNTNYSRPAWVKFVTSGASMDVDPWIEPMLAVYDTSDANNPKWLLWGNRNPVFWFGLYKQVKESDGTVLGLRIESDSPKAFSPAMPDLTQPEEPGVVYVVGPALENAPLLTAGDSRARSSIAYTRADGTQKSYTHGLVFVLDQTSGSYEPLNFTGEQIQDNGGGNLVWLADNGDGVDLSKLQDGDLYYLVFDRSLDDNQTLGITAKLLATVEQSDDNGGTEPPVDDNAALTTVFKEVFGPWANLSAGQAPTYAELLPIFTEHLAEDFLDAGINREQIINLYTNPDDGPEAGATVTSAEILSAFPTFTAPDFNIEDWNFYTNTHYERPSIVGVRFSDSAGQPTYTAQLLCVYDTEAGKWLWWGDRRPVEKAYIQINNGKLQVDLNTHVEAIAHPRYTTPTAPGALYIVGPGFETNGPSIDVDGMNTRSSISYELAGGTTKTYTRGLVFELDNLSGKYKPVNASGEEMTLSTEQSAHNASAWRFGTADGIDLSKFTVDETYYFVFVNSLEQYEDWTVSICPVRLETQD